MKGNQIFTQTDSNLNRLKQNYLLKKYTKRNIYIFSISLFKYIFKSKNFTL